MRFHPLADLFPLMEGAEFDALVADVKANGLHHPIVLYDGKILDGRNRYRACLAAGFEPAVRNGDNWIGDPASFVISRNIRRRHLTAEQKRDLIARLLKAAPEKSDRHGRFAHDLILSDRLLARELANIIMLPGVRERLSADLTNGLAPLGDDADPDSSERTL